MTTKNDIFRVSDLRWTHNGYQPSPEIIAKVDYIENTPEGLKIHLKKEKEIPMVKWKKGDVVYVVETENYTDEYTITDIDYCQCCPDPKAFKVEILRKPKRKPYNGLIYIHYYPGSGLEDRSIYRVINGKIKGCWYHEFAGGPYIFDDMTDATLSRTLQVELYGSDAPSAKVTAYFVHNDQT